MSPPKIIIPLIQLWQRILPRLHRLDQLTHGWLGLIGKALNETLKPASAVSAAAIAYFALFSLFPTVLLSIIIASFHLTPLVNQQSILSKLEFIAPALGQLIGPNIDRIIQTRGPVTVIAMITLIWSASSVFNMLNQSLSEIWGYRRVLPVWERRGLAILIVLVFAGPVLFLASLGGSFLAVLYNWLPLQSTILAKGFSLVLAVFLNIALFLMFYSIFPHGRSTWRDLLAGAIGAGILWEVAKSAFLAFVSGYLSASNLVYGSVAAIIAFLTWAYLSGLIFLFGAYLSFSYFQFRQSLQDTRKS